MGHPPALAALARGERQGVGACGQRPRQVEHHARWGGIAHQADLKGHSAFFVTASQMLLDLSGQESARGLDRRLRHYCSRTALLVLDEVGYLSYDARSADLLFQVVSRRYEQRSLVLTTNLPFFEWPTIFPNDACATALIDRVVHHADIITIEGQSYRRRAAEHDATARKNKTRAA